jgi:hypothetical protein
MQKLYVVRLTDQEREELRSVVKKLKGTGQKVRRAQILLKADAEDRIGPMSVSPRHFPVERERLRGCDSGWLSRVLRRRSIGSNGRSHPCRSC